MKRFIPLFLFMLCVTGCSSKFDTASIESTVQVEMEKAVEVPIPYTIVVADKEKSVKNDPKALAELLSMKLTGFEDDKSDVNSLRPKAIKEAAQLVAIQTAMKWRYENLLLEVEQHAHLLDLAFNFVPLVMVNDNDAVVMPPILTKSNEAMRLEKDTLATSAKTTYEILQNAKYLSALPNWRVYMMVNAFPVPEKPNLTLLPRNEEEKKIWTLAIREAWDEGVLEANELFTKNLSRLVRDYKGVSLYHLLVAQDYLSKVNLASSPAQTKIDANKMFLEQKVFRITEPSKFQMPKQ